MGRWSSEQCVGRFARGSYTVHGFDELEDILDYSACVCTLASPRK